MTISTDGAICYGIALGDGVELPWDTEEYEGDIENWWIYSVCGYTDPVEIWGEDGEYLPDVTEEQTRLYYDSRRAFKKQQPLPIDLIYHCSYDYPMYILAVPGTPIVASRGFPVRFDPDKLFVTPEQHAMLIEFANEHNISFEVSPCWWLSSMWG